MSDSESEDVEAVRLGPQECDRLCNEFADITATDTAIAMMFLQRNMWNLQGAIETFYNQFTKGDDRPLSARLKRDEKNKERPTSCSSESSRPSSSLLSTKRIKVLSWNTDGIDVSETKARASCLSNVVIIEDPDVILLQEVVSDSVKIFDDKLSAKYAINYGNFGTSEGYFTAICLKKEAGTVESSSFRPFNSSRMGRGLQVVEAKIYGVPVTLITSHLESLKDMAEERVRQLKTMFTTARDTDISRVVFAGGDLNLREPELKKAGGIPRGFGDAWEEAGKREQARWTWDMNRNDNHNEDMGEGKFKPRARFDRIYFRSADDVILKPAYFELVGLEKATPLRRFPSDHWGLLFHVDLTPLTTPVA